MTARGAARFFVPGLKDIVWVAVFAGVLGLGPRLMNVDGDLGRHLAIGRYILSTGSVPTRDLFSHTMLGEALTPHEWLAQVLFAAADRLMGVDGVVLLTALVIASAFAVVYRRALAQSRSALVAAAITILAIAASSLHWLTRPHIFTFLLLALWIRLLDRLRCGYLREWWHMPLLMLLWANLHGAFIAGFVTWAIYGFGLVFDIVFERQYNTASFSFWRAYLMGGAASLAATLLNPAGIGLWGTSVGYLGSRYLVSHTAEYLPPDFHSPSAWPFLMLLALLVLVFGLQRRRFTSAYVFLTAAWAAMALYSARNVPLFAIVSAPVLAASLSGLLADYADRAGFFGRLRGVERNLHKIESMLAGWAWPAAAALCAALALTAGIPLDFARSGNRFDPAVFPVAAVDWMADHPQQGSGFNHFPWGGYLLYRLWPGQTVFIDGQTDFYGEALTRQYEQVITLQPGWEEVLEQYHITWVLEPSGSPLSERLSATGRWKVVYQDSTSVLLSAP